MTTHHTPSGSVERRDPAAPQASPLPAIPTMPVPPQLPPPARAGGRGAVGRPARPRGTAAPAEPSEARRQHLDFLQTVINRQAGNSSVIKGWSLTVAAIIYTYSAQHQAWAAALSGAALLTAFWWLDAFYLRQERLFRCLYDRARLPDTAVELYAMDTEPYRGEARASWRQVAFSPTLRVLYPMTAAIGVVLALAMAL